MDDLKTLLNRWLNFKGDKREFPPPPPVKYPVEDEEEYREDEIAFVVGLEEVYGNQG